MALYAFDGTWNEDEAGEIAAETNVVRFHEAYTGRKFYLQGVGTRAGFIGKILGGLTGLGGRCRIRDAMEAVEKNFAAGDREIDIIGFSRGAALALHFANEVNDELNGAAIRFLGVWDTVASFGLPGNDLNVRWTLTLPANVERCYHAMSLDERRGNFPLTRIKAAVMSIPFPGVIQEVWFRGVHSDVGGGQCVGLSSIALCWMLGNAKKVGLPIDAVKFAHYSIARDIEAQISKNFDLKADAKRVVDAGDAVHESVQTRGIVNGCDHNDPPAACVVVRD
jgi:uncharacterized protein (DUF2235 family)